MLNSKVDTIKTTLMHEHPETPHPACLHVDSHTLPYICSLRTRALSSIHCFCIPSMCHSGSHTDRLHGINQPCMITARTVVNLEYLINLAWRILDRRRTLECWNSVCRVTGMKTQHWKNLWCPWVALQALGHLCSFFSIISEKHFHWVFFSILMLFYSKLFLLSRRHVLSFTALMLEAELNRKWVVLDLNICNICGLFILITKA